MTPTEQIVEALGAGQYIHDQRFGDEPYTIARAIDALFQQAIRLSKQVRELERQSLQDQTTIAHLLKYHHENR